MQITARLAPADENWTAEALVAMDGMAVGAPNGGPVGTVVGPAWVEDGWVLARMEVEAPDLQASALTGLSLSPEPPG